MAIKNRSRSYYFTCINTCGEDVLICLILLCHAPHVCDTYNDCASVCLSRHPLFTLSPSACRSLNEGTQEKCQTCGGDRLIGILPPLIGPNPSGSSTSVSFPWYCPFCTYENGPAAVCGMCSKPRPTGEPRAAAITVTLCLPRVYVLPVFRAENSIVAISKSLGVHSMFLCSEGVFKSSPLTCL